MFRGLNKRFSQIFQSTSMFQISLAVKGRKLLGVAGQEPTHSSGGIGSHPGNLWIVFGPASQVHFRCVKNETLFDVSTENQEKSY